MEKSNESNEFEDWELIPVTKHSHTPISSSKEVILAIDTDYFSNECKIIDVVPQSPLNDDPIIGTRTESPKFRNEDEDEDEDEDGEEMISSKKKKEKQSFWMIGALSSIGAAAVTICVIVFAGKNVKNQNSRNIQFQLYTDEKRIREVVKQATQMRHALSAVRGNSTTRRARVSFGGYYDRL